MNKSPIRTVKTKANGSAMRSDPSRTATLRRLFEEQIAKRFRQLKKAIVQLVAVEDCFGLRDIVENFNPSQPRDYRGRWSSSGGVGGKGTSTEVTDKEFFKNYKYFLDQTSTLPEDEEKALIGLRIGEFGNINRALRGVSDNPNHIAMAQSAVSGFNKLAEPLKKDSLLYRGMTLSDEFISKNLQEGAEFINSGFTATSISKHMTEGTRQSESWNVKFELEVPKGTKVLRLSDKYSDEKELTLGPGTITKIIAVTSEGEFTRVKAYVANQLLTANKRYKFLRTPQQVEAFRRWLIEQANGVVLDDIESDSAKQAFWTEYVIEGYKKGMGRAFDDIHNGYAAKFAKDGSTDDFYDGTKFEFLKSSFGRPETVEKIQLLAGRVFTDLKGVSDSMAAAMSRTLVDGLSQGAGPMEIADNLVDDAGLSENRAKMVARTELMRAHNEGALDAMEEMGVEEIGVMVEWSTGGHNVCPLCKALEKIVLTVKEARGMFPRHPNCKCVPIPANVGENTNKQKRSKSDIDSAITESISRERPKKIPRTIQEQKKRSTWQGVDKKIDKERPEPIIDGEL